MILEAIYSGDFYPSETVVPKSEKYRNALKKAEQRRLRPGGRTPGSGFHRSERGE